MLRDTQIHTLLEAHQSQIQLYNSNLNPHNYCVCVCVCANLTSTKSPLFQSVHKLRQTHQPLPISTTMVCWLIRVTHSARRSIWAASLPCLPLGVCVWHFKHPAQSLKGNTTGGRGRSLCRPQHNTSLLQIPHLLSVQDSGFQLRKQQHKILICI